MIIIFKMIVKFNRHLKESKSHENKDGNLSSK